MQCLIWHKTTQLSDGITSLVEPWKLPGKNMADQFYAVRPLGPTNLDRKAKTYEFSFVINRIHASEADARAFRTSHNQTDLANVADLTIREVAPDGTTIVTTMLAAWWETVEVELRGQIATRTSYRISGGPVTVQRLAGTGNSPLSTEAGVTLETESGTTLQTE